MNTVLLVDGDAFSRNVFARALTKDGFLVHQADTEADAVAILDAVDVDAISIDGSTDDDGGTAIVRAIRTHGHTQPVVLLRSVFREETRDATPNDIAATLHKPLAPSALAAALRQVLGSRSSTDAIELMRSQNKKFAEGIDQEIFALEVTIRERRDTGSDPERALFEATRLVESSRQHGFVRVSQALGRIEQALLKIDERQGQLNRQLWTEVNDALDEAYIAAHSHALEHRNKNLDRGSTTRENVQVLLLDEDADIAPQLEAYGAKHLFSVRTVHTARDLFDRIHDPGLHAIFVDIDSNIASSQALQTIRLLRERSRLDTIPPVAVVAKVSDTRDRLLAAQVNAVRYLQKPVDDNEFADAVQYMAALAEPVNRSVVIVRSKDADTSLDAPMAHDGFHVRVVHDVSRLLTELERADAGAAIIHSGGSAPATEIIRMLRAIPRWSDFPIIYYALPGDPHAHDAIIAGADEVFTPKLKADKALARLSVRIQRTHLLLERADRDLLTGLLMRRAFLERFSVRLSEARRQNRSLALCLLDLDHFKEVNDTYGHLAGDKVLMELGRQLKAQYRMEDLRGRWGGEEFAVALINEDSQVAFHALQRVLDAFEATEFEGDDGTVFHCTFSAGIAEFPKDGDRFEELLKKADERLFMSKVAGRNRITK